MNRITTFAITILLLAFCIDAQSPDDRSEAISVVNKLFEGMRAKNADQIKSVFATEGQLVAIDKPRDGKGISKTRTFSGEAFAKMISEAKGADLIEKMPEPEARISGDLAIVTGRYTFYVGDKFSHCGTNTFNLVRNDSGWKIANGASTLEFQCERDLKAVEITTIDADPKDVATLDCIIKAFYETISGPKGRPRQWSRDRTLYTPNVRFVSLGEQNGKIRVGTMGHQQFANANNDHFVTNGFTEREINRVTRRFGNLAHVFSTYEFTDDAKTEKGRGINSIELFWDGTRWWISSASWDDERPNNPIPKQFLPNGRR